MAGCALCDRFLAGTESYNMRSMHRQKFVTPMERRALALAEAMADASGLRWQSSQLPGLAFILMAFAQNEIRIAASSPAPK